MDEDLERMFMLIVSTTTKWNEGRGAHGGIA
jgi:hypothetical protein